MCFSIFKRGCCTKEYYRLKCQARGQCHQAKNTHTGKSNIFVEISKNT